MALFKKAPARGVYGVKQAALFLGVGEDDIIRAIEENALPARKLGGKWLVARPALIRWLEEGTPPIPPAVALPRPRLPLLLTAFNLRQAQTNAIWAL